MLSIFLLYLGIGSLAGLLAGLFGIGGGMVIVPMMVVALGWQGVSQDAIMHLALGTSLGSILFTSISSSHSHHKRGGVHWDVVKRIVPGIFVGTFLGASIASRLSTGFLKGFFVIFLYYVALQMFLNKKPNASREVPGRWGMFGAGSVIGSISSLVGIGGGTLSVPFMIWCNLPVHHAIGTSAAIGFPIAVAGAFGYIVNGLGVPSLPPYSLGFLYLPGVAGIAAASVLTAPLGVRLAHSLPVNHLKRIFAVLLIVVGTRMAIGLFDPNDHDNHDNFQHR